MSPLPVDLVRWMILAEKRGLLTSEERAAAWRRHDARLMAPENVVGLIRMPGVEGMWPLEPRRRSI